MGINTNSLTNILLGVGLGIIAVSCLAVTICFGHFANSKTEYEKIKMMLSYDQSGSLYDCSIVISVLGCISAVAAIAAIALTIILEDQTLILIIVGGVSALFAFGCIVAEGIYSQKAIAAGSGYYTTEYSRKGSQKYIKKAIRELYEQGIENLKAEHGNSDLPSWSSIEKKLGKADEEGHVFTYSDIWKGENSRCFEDRITLHLNSYSRPTSITAKISNNQNYGCVTSTVASINFLYNKSFTPKMRACWYNTKRTDIKCTNVKGEEKYPEMVVNTIYPSLREYIVVGDYVPLSDENKDADYEVNNFPFAYKKLTYQEIDENENGLIFEDSSRHYKFKAKKYAKAGFNAYKKEATNPEKEPFILVKHKPKSIEDISTQCENVTEEEKNILKICSFRYNDDGIDFDDIIDILALHYKNTNKGKVASSIKKFYNSQTKSEFNSYWLESRVLYCFAIMNLIIQIVGILFWAAGRFLGLLLGGGDAKTASEGEA